MTDEKPVTKEEFWTVVIVSLVLIISMAAVLACVLGDRPTSAISPIAIIIATSWGTLVTKRIFGILKNGKEEAK